MKKKYPENATFYMLSLINIDLGFFSLHSPIEIEIEMYNKCDIYFSLKKKGSKLFDKEIVREDWNF